MGNTNILREHYPSVLLRLLLPFLLVLLTTVAKTYFGLTHTGLFTVYYSIIFLSGLIGGTLSVVAAVLGSIVAIISFMTNSTFDPRQINVYEAIVLIIFALETVTLAYFSQRLYQSEYFLRRLFETISDPFVVISNQGVYLYGNRSVRELLGISQFTGQQAWNIFPKRGTQVYNLCQQAIRTRRSTNHTYFSAKFQTWINLVIYPSELGISLLFKDIGKQKQAEAALREKEAQFQRLIDSNIIGVAIENNRGEVQYANDVYLSLVGYTRADLAAGRLNWRHITPPQWLAKDDQMTPLLFKQGYIQPYEKEYQHKSGRLVPIIKGAVMINRRQKTSIVFALDISDRKEVERRKDEFISIASHELKTPLTSIKGYTQLLLKHLPAGADSKSHTYLLRMLGQINRLAYLVNDLLDVRKIQEGKLEINPEYFDLYRLLSTTVKEAQTLTQRHQIRLESAPETLIYSDYYRLSQVITNLLSNAIKYSPEDTLINVTLKQNNHSVTITVNDQGIGIPRSKQKQVFTKYYQIRPHDNSSGLGLGLYISSQIIEKLGGKMTIKSPLYKANPPSRPQTYGSAVSFQLPLEYAS